MLFNAKFAQLRIFKMAKLSLFFKTCSIVIVIFAWVYTILNFNNLPDVIPVHFDVNGDPDGFGSKYTIWFLLIVATLCSALMFYLSVNLNSPLLNIPQNLKEHKTLGSFFVNLLNVTISLIFLFIIYESFQLAFEVKSSLSSSVFYLSGSVLLIIIAMMVASRKIQKNKKSLID